MGAALPEAQTADLALDGQLIPEREDPVSLEQVLAELQRAGIRATGDEVPEEQLRDAWYAATPGAPAARVRRAPAPIPPLMSSEQLDLFAA